MAHRKDPTRETSPRHLFTVRFSDEEHGQLARLAKQRGTTMSAALRQAINEAMT